MAKIISKELGHKIDALRIHYDLNHRQLASSAGLSTSTISRLCKGEIGELDALERVFGVLGVYDQILPALISLLPDASLSPYDTNITKRKRVRRNNSKVVNQKSPSIWPEDS